MYDTLEELKILILGVVKSITKVPEEVIINAKQEYSVDKGSYTLINIKVATEDVPVCIGSGGSTADAIRRLSCIYARNVGYTERLYVRIDAPTMPANHFFND